MDPLINYIEELSNKICTLSVEQKIPVTTIMAILRASVSREARERRETKSQKTLMDQRYRVYHVVFVAQNNVGQFMRAADVINVAGLGRVPFELADFARYAFGEAPSVDTWMFNERSTRVTMSAHGVASPMWAGPEGHVTAHIHTDQGRAVMHLAQLKKENERTFEPGNKAGKPISNFIR